MDVRLDIFPSTNIMLLACAADDNKIHLFVELKKSEIDNLDPHHRFQKIYSVAGHDDWVRSMDFLHYGNSIYLIYFFNIIILPSIPSGIYFQ